MQAFYFDSRTLFLGGFSVWARGCQAGLLCSFSSADAGVVFEAGLAGDDDLVAGLDFG